VRYFFYIGGNDSADTARIVHQMATRSGQELRVFHIPKTIDNDLRATDHCPGYGSAARFVACAVMGDDRDNASLPGIKIDVIMGRNAGWLTAAAALARSDQDDGPHLIYLPERPLSADRFCADVKEVHERLGRCLVAMSEGVTDENRKVWGEKILTAGETDAHGNVQLSGTGSLGDYFANLVKTRVSAMLGGNQLRVRADTFGYLQRAFAGFSRPTDAREARMVGRKAVQFAMAGHASGSVSIVRKKGARYAVDYARVELADMARQTRPLPDEFIAPSGHDVTAAFLDYARPLAGKLPEIARL
jgi:6-phosphofructokinase